MPQFGWRAMVNADGHNFVRNTIAINLAYRGPEGLQLVKPFKLELGEPIEPDYIGAELPVTPTELPREAAEILLEALGHALLGSGDMVREIYDLRFKLSKAESRLDALIGGIGRLGAGGATVTPIPREAADVKRMEPF